MARPCSVCRHPNGSEIDTAIINGQSLRSVSKKFRIGATAVFRLRLLRLFNELQVHLLSLFFEPFYSLFTVY